MNRLAAPLVLLFTLVVLTGATAFPLFSAETVTAERCCDRDVDQQTPPTEGECADIDCRCPTCSASILINHPFLKPSTCKPSSSIWPLASIQSSDYIRSIDYPPETV